jgi:hypothetical protein
VNLSPRGAAAFWAAFPFQFDDLELAHLRHGFRNAVIMGGNPFGTGGSPGGDYGSFSDILSNIFNTTAGRELEMLGDDQHRPAGRHQGRPDRPE